MQTSRDRKGRFALQNGVPFQGMLRSGTQNAVTDRQNVHVDILDRMHGKAKQGATLAAMHRAFPEINPDMLEYWFRQNGFMNKNGKERIQQADKARRLRTKRRILRERRLRNAIFSK